MHTPQLKNMHRIGEFIDDFFFHKCKRKNALPSKVAIRNLNFQSVIILVEIDGKNFNAICVTPKN